MTEVQSSVLSMVTCDRLINCNHQRVIISSVHLLASSLCQIDDYSLVRFLPLDPSEEDSMSDLLFSIDTNLQYDEDQDVKIPRDREEDNDGGGGDGAGGGFNF